MWLSRIYCEVLKNSLTVPLIKLNCFLMDKQILTWWTDSPCPTWRLEPTVTRVAAPTSNRRPFWIFRPMQRPSLISWLKGSRLGLPDQSTTSWINWPSSCHLWLTLHLILVSWTFFLKYLFCITQFSWWFLLILFFFSINFHMI